MKIADYFAGVGVKTLTPHEIDPSVSNGHEFQGIKALEAFLGTPAAGEKFPAKYLYLSDGEPPLRVDSSATWYDCRLRDPKRNAEGRILYPAEVEDLVFKAKVGDTLFVCLTRERGLMLLLCPQGSDIERQLLWLFGLQLKSRGTDILALPSGAGADIGFAGRYILDLVEVEVEINEASWLDGLVATFGDAFPTTAVFSEYARSAVGEVDAVGQPDETLMAWLDFEERLFRTFERHLVSDRLEEGFAAGGHIDVDGFVQFSLSVQNRRKARAGYALENHLAVIFQAHGIRFERGAITEGKKKPDFLFPGAKSYHSEEFPQEALTLLGSKSSCKDRWRQVLSEGAKVTEKHLLTLEPSISPAQTSEMAADDLQLVVPRPLHLTYLPSQRDWLMDLSDFSKLVLGRQAVGAARAIG